jgi:hypothetical protein
MEDLGYMRSVFHADLGYFAFTCLVLKSPDCRRPGSSSSASANFILRLSLDDVRDISRML